MPPEANSHDRMHYAIVLVLMISVITTFLLGVLLTEAMFNPGISYFASLGETLNTSRTQAAVLQNQKQLTGQFMPPQVPTPAVSIDNRFVGKEGTGNDAVYTFAIKITNTGNTELKQIGFTYEYDTDVLELMTLSPALKPTSGATSALFKDLLRTKVAHAQVSIDFPLPPANPRCSVDRETGTLSCTFGSLVDTLQPGMAWQFDLQFRPADDSLSLESSIFQKAFNWIVGVKKAQGQVSIDFPPFPVTTKTTATIPFAIDINNWKLKMPVSSVATAEL